MGKEQDKYNPVSVVLVAIASWLVPGSGYVLMGKKARGLTIGLTILLLFGGGLLIGGARIVETPDSAAWSDLQRKPWFVVQSLTGAIALGTGYVVSHARPPLPMSHARSWEIGTLYTAVAGMLNLLAIIDACSRSAQQEDSGGESPKA